MNAPSSSSSNSDQPRTVTVLGSTGSVGTQTIELLAAEPGRFKVRALVGGRNAELLAKQAVALRAEIAVVADVTVYAVSNLLSAVVTVPIPAISVRGNKDHGVKLLESRRGARRSSFEP